ncbi:MULTISPECIES: hypothetical protein [unclassified Corallococcus]|uniref:hypothetical protein n=1 Tax=unclassified Corallococcus TaxID=2685029 RepID=UPI001A90ACF0|nr:MULTISPECIES: hypothetical protein [unclassified Corallococcus]MBN9685999.1 hypothetical protein [Corallococcus sp. NCSPR001]WAS82563.1 hypothetical protein O0N60_24930 [Corallococcus sp. NCRR]
MLRLCGLLVLTLTLACAERPPPPAPRTWPRSQNSGLGTVTSVERVHITQGFQVLRGATLEEVTVHEGLLIKLQDLSPVEFLPRAMSPPSLVLGDSFAEMIDGLDCGVCPQGQTCTADNTCCTPATCASLGRSCGTVVPDGCGHALDCGACPVR